MPLALLLLFSLLNQIVNQSGVLKQIGKCEKHQFIQHSIELLLCQVLSLLQHGHLSLPQIHLHHKQPELSPLTEVVLSVMSERSKEKISLMPESYSWQPYLRFSAVLHQGKCCNLNYKLKKIKINK